MSIPTKPQRWRLTPVVSVLVLLLNLTLLFISAHGQEFSCEGKQNGKLYAHPWDCSRFYQCSNGRAIGKQCRSPKLNFNERHGICTWGRPSNCVRTPGQSTRRTREPMTQRPTTERTTKRMATPRTKPTSGGMGNGGAGASGKPCQRVVGYFIGWGRFRKRMEHVASDVDVSLYTHLIFSFAKVSNNRLTIAVDDPGSCKQLVALKKKKSSLKVLLAVGGWTHGSTTFIPMVKTRRNRQTFIESTISVLRQYGFDGLDFDWEYPAKRGSKQGDRERFTTLVREMRAAFQEEAKRTGQEMLLITIAIGAGKDTIDVSYNMDQLGIYMDFINVMTYDYRGHYNPNTGHHSPLYKDTKEKNKAETYYVEYTMDYLVKLGTPKDKLVLGLPLYGRSFTLASSANTDIGSPAIASRGPQGEFTREAGFLSYYEICKYIKDGAKVYRAPAGDAPYLVKGTEWVSYDDEQSFRLKVKYSREQGFGGVMVWDTSMDDVTGTACNRGPNPMMTAVNDECQA